MMNKSRVESGGPSRKAEQELIDLKTRFAEYQKDNRKLRQKNEQMTKDIQSIQEINENLTRENANLVKQNKQLQEACKKLESKMTHGMTKCNMIKLEVAVNKLKEKNQQQNSQIEQLEELTKKQAKEIQILNKTWEEKFAGDEDLERLVYELNTLRIENEQYSSTLEQRSYKLEAVEQELQEITQQRDTYRANYETVMSDLETKSKKLQELQDQLDCIQSERNDALEEKETLLQVIEDNTQQLTRSRSQTEQFSVENTQLRDQISSLRNQFETCATELTATRERLSESNQMLLLKENQLNEECKVRVYLQQIEGELRMYLQQMEMKNAELSHQLDVFNELNLNCQDKISEGDRDKTTLNEQIQQLKHRIEELQAELDTIESRRDHTENEIREKLETTSQELAEVNRSRSELQNQVIYVSEELRRTKDALENIQVDHSSLLEKHAKLEEGKRLMQQTLMDQLSNEREQTKLKDQKIEELNSVVSLLRDEKSSLQEILESQKRAKEIARSKKKILKQAKQKIQVLDESRMSQDNKENESFVSTCSSINKSIQKQSLQSSQSSFLSSTHSNNISDLNNSNLSSNNKSYISVGCDDYQRPSSLDISGADRLPMSANQVNQVPNNIQMNHSTSLINTSVQSLNSSVLYPTPPIFAQGRLGGIFPYSSVTSVPSVPSISGPPLSNRYISTNGHPLNLFELASISSSTTNSTINGHHKNNNNSNNLQNGVASNIQRGIPHRPF